MTTKARVIPWEKLQNAARWMAVSWVVWTAVFLVDVGSVLSARAANPEWFGPILPSRAVVLRAVTWYTWWLWTPVVFWVAGRFRFEPGRRTLSVVIHVCSMIGAVELVRVTGLMAKASMGLATFTPLITIYGVVQYAAVWGVAGLIDHARERRRSELASAALSSQLAEARFEALASQLHPHFLYNALNGVAMWIRAKQPDKALEMVLAYSDLLRTAIGRGPGEVRLEEEIRFVERYLDVERLRFEGRLRTAIAIDEECGAALVPSLLLQPLVENAVKHGLANNRDGGVVDIHARRHGSMLRIEVSDNGVGLSGDWQSARLIGVGLRNTGARLTSRYGKAHRLELLARPEGGIRVVVEFPYQIQDDSSIAASLAKA